jgi:choline-sulfatase
MNRVTGGGRSANGRGQRAAIALALALCPLPLALSACSGAPPAKRPARNVVLVTIDTLRADHVGAYGGRARTPALDALAAGGTRFERAYAAAPITLPSHATLLTGRYPPGHGARDNGMHVSSNVPTLATELHARGFRTGAFVAAFPLDHQFGLARGFDAYGDRLPRQPNGQLANERPGSQVIDEAIAWLGGALSAQSPQPFFLWVHLFEPHAPYGDPTSSRSALDRYDDEIATADREVGRLIAALAPVRADTLIVAAGDHGEAFGEHGEYAHSIFVYDTTLHVPLIFNGPGISAGAHVSDPVTLADVAPTMMRMIGAPMHAVDGVDLAPALAGGSMPARELYAESFAPLVEFGWAPLRAIRSGPWKLIAAPKPELFDIERDAGELNNLTSSQSSVVERLTTRAGRYAPAMLSNVAGADPQAAERLRALGYSSGSSISSQPSAISHRPDPKDRRDVAGRIAQITAGELSGTALLSALEALVRDDPRNGQAHLRLGIARLQAGDCAHGEPELHAAAAAGLPSADIYLGLASCLGQRRDLAGAEQALNEARRIEPDNPAVTANLGILREARGDHAGAIDLLKTALTADPDLHEARFNLALAYMRAGRKTESAAAARQLLARLPAGAPERPEVERFLKTVQ